jgi:hypothetical protein
LSYENGSRRPNLDRIEAWAEACGRRLVLSFEDDHGQPTPTTPAPTYGPAILAIADQIEADWCRCIDAYKDRGRTDPTCDAHGIAESLRAAAPEGVGDEALGLWTRRALAAESKLRRIAKLLQIGGS